MSFKIIVFRLKLGSNAEERSFSNGFSLCIIFATPPKVTKNLSPKSSRAIQRSFKERGVY